MTKYSVSNSYSIGRSIKARRKELKMTQKQLAETAGCSFQQIQKYEHEISKISVPTFLKICSCLRTHPNYFFNGFSFQEGDSNHDDNLEIKLLGVFRSVSNEKLKSRIVKLIEAVISTNKDV
jgi:transcriptional regulator with XRE-family HTH domain